LTQHEQIICSLIRSAHICTFIIYALKLIYPTGLDVIHDQYESLT